MILTIVDYFVFASLVFSISYSVYQNKEKHIIGLIGITLAYLILRFM